MSLAVQVPEEREGDDGGAGDLDPAHRLLKDFTNYCLKLLRVAVVSKYRESAMTKSTPKVLRKEETGGYTDRVVLGPLHA
jgi:hypothetical protein